MSVTAIHLYCLQPSVTNVVFLCAVAGQACPIVKRSAVCASLPLYRPYGGAGNYLSMLLNATAKALNQGAFKGLSQGARPPVDEAAPSTACLRDTPPLQNGPN